MSSPEWTVDWFSVALGAGGMLAFSLGVAIAFGKALGRCESWTWTDDRRN